ncbi:WcaF family extracellular polysaccharide biosynthesis acetyltransferase [Pedobacter nyackensis]|uniref:WcaF family extracellular polysaccharide biosynthesis acetyltransferase n=1 Tax=Pedobacter nyackensis TaxID=475255 RepID=UPI00292D841F|nr:WcaF family extracellular polysaccharide biosynthesis acetyltransferase [Pedobacter nyackensis]
MSKTNLSFYVKPALNLKHGFIKRTFWFIINAWVFKTSLFPSSRLKVQLLRWFGASIGKSVVIKPCVNIKYPWLLQIGDHSWIGEKVWIDNLVAVCIGHHVCISQGALLLTGSHNYKDPRFELIKGRIIIADGVWIGARAIVNQGITVKSHAVLSAGSVATKQLEAMSIYQGNPAIKVRKRIFNNPSPN